MLTISKEKSQLIKGIVICMMVWLHLFNGNHTDLCHNFLYVGDEPFAKWLSNACGPVSFFLLLSGYGLAYTYDKGKLSVKGQVTRLFRLYAHYWVVLMLFVPIGCFVASQKYPGSWYILLSNATGWHTIYNAEMWFLFPYCTVALASPLIFRTMEKVGNVQLLVLAAMTHIVTCYCISRYGALYFYGNMVLYQPLLFFHFLFPFVLGAFLYRTKMGLNRQLPQWMVIVLIILSVSIVATFGNAVVYMAYVPLMTWLFCHLAYPKWLDYVLMELGRKSMVIWMAHTWYCYYLFQSQVYSLKYPVVIMGGVIMVSYLTAVVVMWITGKVLKLLKI